MRLRKLDTETIEQSGFNPAEAMYIEEAITESGAGTLHNFFSHYCLAALAGSRRYEKDYLPAEVPDGRGGPR
jgi:hypothetical protein